MVRIFCVVEMLSPTCSGLGLGSCILYLFCCHPISRCCFLLAWRIGIWGMGLELRSVDFDSSGLCMVDFGKACD
jgi:hypothetical protein